MQFSGDILVKDGILDDELDTDWVDVEHLHGRLDDEQQLQPFFDGELQQ